MRITSTLVAFVLCTAIQAQQQTLATQNDTWNSTYEITQAQARGANLTDAELADISLALNFERSNWATGSVAEDAFYSLPSNASDAVPGSVIKVQTYTNTSTYTLPPNTALSRIIFMTEDLNSTAVPASAYILWPYLPRTQADGKYPLVTWGHGTSGSFAECGPSHIRNLWYQYSAPYALALAGYIVVAPDYRGLGINETADGDPIYHSYMASQSAGTDLLYAVQAAQSAFPSISKNFIVMGHSQGGGAAWGAAVRQAQTPIPGYLGTVAASPNTNITGLIDLYAGSPIIPPTLTFFWANALRGLHPTLNLSTILTPTGIARLTLASNLGMCNSALGPLLPPGSTPYLVQPSWLSVPEVAAYLSSVDLGNQLIAGPMLVLQGTADLAVPEQFTTAAVNETCTLYPSSAISYWRFANVTHVPVLYASQRLWLDWIGQRFDAADKEGNDGGDVGSCSVRDFSSGPMPPENYQGELEYYLELATQGYQVA